MDARTLVAGPGAIGGFVAARLALAGHRVEVLATPAGRDALAAAPLRLTDDGSEHSVALDATDDPARAAQADLVVVCVKSYDTAALAAALAPHLRPGTSVLSLQNGVDNADRIALAAPHALVGAAAVYLGCRREAPGRIIRRPSRDPVTGALRDRLAGGGSGALVAHLEWLGHALGVPVRPMADPRPALWTKLVANACLNTVTALGRARVGAVFARPPAVALMRAIGAEVVAVARAAGVDLPADAGDRYVADAAGRLPPEGGSSTLFDLQDGRRLEREALIGYVVHEGARRGVPVPVCRACAALLELADPWQAAGAA
ncbi:MAG: ketopantoate reductase family protein [Miltoncostaeaceae bacterium]